MPILLHEQLSHNPIFFSRDLFVPHNWLVETSVTPFCHTSWGLKLILNMEILFQLLTVLLGFEQIFTMSSKFVCCRGVRKRLHVGKRKHIIALDLLAELKTLQSICAVPTFSNNTYRFNWLVPKRSYLYQVNLYKSWNESKSSGLI